MNQVGFHCTDNSRYGPSWPLFTKNSCSHAFTLQTVAATRVVFFFSCPVPLIFNLKLTSLTQKFSSGLQSSFPETGKEYCRKLPAFLIP